MTTSSRPPRSMDDLRELLVDFGLPALVLAIAGILIFTGRDSEIKTIFAGAAGWLFKSGYAEYRRHRRR